MTGTVHVHVNVIGNFEPVFGQFKWASLLWMFEMINLRGQKIQNLGIFFAFEMLIHEEKQNPNIQ